MGEDSKSDVERKGSMGRRWRSSSSRGVHPVQSVQESFQPVQMPQERRRISVLVPVIVVVNVVMFIITMYVNDCPKNTLVGSCVLKFLGRLSFQPLSENPLIGPSSAALVKMGALDVNKVIHHDQGWRLITCIWLHAGVVHIAANMLSLLFIGIRLEQEFGMLKIGIIYLLSGFGGSLLSALFLQNSISVGASGALFGLLGAMLSELFTNWTIYANKCAALMTLVLVVALNLAVGILPHVDNFAHIGGFVTGFLLGFVLLVRPQYGWVDRGKYPPGQTQSPRKSKHKLYQYVLWVAALVALIVGFIVVIVLVFQGVDGNKTCSWCHYLSCVPTSKWKCDNSGSSTTCSTETLGNNMQMICLSNNKTSTFPQNESDSYLQQLCSQLCS